MLFEACLPYRNPDLPKVVVEAFKKDSENARQRAQVERCNRKRLMIHYFSAPATAEVVEYLRFGGREFYTHKEGPDKELTVRFLATEEYVAKMQARPFLRNVNITRKA